MNVHTVASETTTPGMDVTRATVYVPAGKEHKFLEKLRQYRDEDAKSGNPRNYALINSIEDVHLAVLESFWQDDPEQIPDETAVWCEIWLRDEAEDTETSFRELVAELGIVVRKGVLRFPERMVLLTNVNREQLTELMEASSNVAEFRLGKETARFFLEMDNRDQTDWAESLKARLSVNPNPSVAVTVLDTGANNGHILLGPLLKDADRHTLDPEWGLSDHAGHGTLMCGVAGYGDLQEAMESSGEIKVEHCLESVKILPPQGSNDPALYGELTIQAMSRAEVQAPKRNHIACMAITATKGRDRGRPSSWSAAVDQLTSGHDDHQKLLFIVSAGNVEESDEWSRYPDSNLTYSIEDPGQSWNALTVGACTNKTTLYEPGLQEHTPLANFGGLSPFSSTSLTWEKKWPIKPEIMLEGGNVAKDPGGFISLQDDLSLLSTGPEPTQRQFDLFNATSAASARAAWMAAQIQASYPDAWPETIRGLLVHSAEWTEEMKRQFLESEKKSDYARLLRVCGYGVPDLGRALSCYENSLTLVSQEELQPYDKKVGKSGVRTKEMHLHELPWPRDELLDLGETLVTLRITLSYFIEPGPGEVGWRDRYRYASHGLRFKLNNLDEDRETFIQRLNAEAREDGEKPESTAGSERWLFGQNSRDMGSIHSDIWNTTAADLATCNMIGVVPIIGWWRERSWLERWKRKTRYSLIVSIKTPATDIYTPVAHKLKIPVTIQGN